MALTPSTERRRHPRLALSAGVRFHHEPTRCSLPGLSANISKGGMLMYVPATAPVRPGQAIRLLSLPGPGRAQFATPDGQPLGGVIVRVERDVLLSRGQLAVGVRFETALN